MQRACIYTRISHDREGEALGVARQEEDCRKLAERLGYTVGRVYVDNDISASTRSRRRRPQYEQMFEDVKRGLWDAIIAYSNSRLTRRPLELEDIITLHEQTGVVIHTVVSGQDDLSTADGRMVARIKAAVDAAEAERAAERVARKHAERRRRALPHAGPPIFGYVRADPSKGVGHCQVVDEQAAKALRQAADIVLNGGSLTAVRNLWNAMGVKTVHGKEWRSLSTIKRTLTNPRLAGLIVHNGEIVGEGSWPKIWDRNTYEALVATLSDRAAGRKGPRPRRHLLVGFVYCVCGNRMYVQQVDGGRTRYICLSEHGGCGRVARSKKWLDTMVDAYITARIEAEYQAQPTQNLEEHATRLHKEIHKLEEQITRLRDAYTAGVFTLAEVSEKIIPLREKIQQLRSEQVAAIQENVRIDLDAADAIALWKLETPDTLGQRRALFSRYVQRIIVKPVGRIGGRPIPPDSIEIVPVP